MRHILEISHLSPIHHSFVIHHQITMGIGFVFLAVLGGVAMGQDVCPPGEVFWPHPDCNLYYTCNNGNPLVSQCPSGLFWNQNGLYCDFAVNVPECQGGTREPVGGETTVALTTKVPTTTVATTVTTTTVATTTLRTTTTPPTTTTVPTTTTAPPTTTPESPETEGTEGPTPGECPPDGIHKVPHETLCDSYYICIAGTRDPTIFSCAEGLYFDPSIEECNLATEVDCVPITTTTTIAPTRPNLPECPPSGIVQLPYPGNCTLYIMCIEEVPILYRCPDGMIFDSVDHECQPEGVGTCNEELKPNHHGYGGYEMNTIYYSPKKVLGYLMKNLLMRD